MSKLVASPATAVADIGDGASIGIAGFGVAYRFPSSLIIALRDQGTSGLTVYCNGLGQPGFTPEEVAGLTRMDVDMAAPVGIMQESWGD